MCATFLWTHVTKTELLHGQIYLHSAVSAVEEGHYHSATGETHFLYLMWWNICI